MSQLGGLVLVSVDEFRERLRRLLDVLGYSQRDIADTCGVSQQSISRWKSGASIPPVDRLAELTPVLERLEDEARRRWDAPPDLAQRMQAFLRGSGLGGLVELLPVPANRAVWNPRYAELTEELVAKVPLLKVEIPLGHGISTLARTAAERIRESFPDVISIRLGIERLAATLSGASEEQTYRSLLHASYGWAAPADDPPQDEQGLLPAPDELARAVRHVVAGDIRGEFSREAWRNTLRPARFAQVKSLLEASDEGWRDALVAADSLAQAVVVLDLSPSPAGRKYVDSTDVMLGEHAGRVAAIVQAVADVTKGLPRVSFVVLVPERLDADLSALEDAARSSAWDMLEPPPRLERTDFLNILAVHAGSGRAELDRVIDPRFSLDLHTRGISSANVELAQKLARALAATEDNAGVVREKDASVADAVIQMRLHNLERQVEDLAKTQQRILTAISKLEHPVRAAV